MKSVGMRPPVGDALGRIACERNDVFDPVGFEPVQDGADVVFGLVHNGQVAHDLQSDVIMEPGHNLNSLVPRASTGAVGDRAKRRIECLENLHFPEESGVALRRLRRKELDRKGQTRSGVEIA